MSTENAALENLKESISKPDISVGITSSYVVKDKLARTSNTETLTEVALNLSETKESNEPDLALSKSQQVTVVNDELSEVRESFVGGDRKSFEVGAAMDLAGGTEELKNEQPEVLFVDLEPPFKKNRRIQVPSTDITTGISRIEPSPKKKPAKQLHDPTPQKIGVLIGVPCGRRSSQGTSENQQLDMLKHLTLVFLFSRLKNPMKWEASTFEKIRSLGDTITTEMVMAKLSIDFNGKTYNMALTSTLIKGRINSSEAAPPAFKNALIEHVSGYSGLVVKCESKYMITWKIADGYYLYDPCLNDSSQLMFFNSLKMMMQFIVVTKQLTNKSKFYMSKISWSSVDDGQIVTLKRKSRVAKKFGVLNLKEALLMGNKYLKEISFKLESLRISLNAISLAQNLEARSWDASNLDKLFDGEMMDRTINKLGIFLCENDSEECFVLEKLRLIRLTAVFRYTEREEFELLVNRLLVIRTALVVKIEEAYFSIWSSENIIYWFSPFRYDALELDPAELEHKACFLFAFNSLARLSYVLFEYCTELGLLPRHSIRMFTVDAEPFAHTPRLPMVDSKDSLNRSELEIRVAEGIRKKQFVSDGNLPAMTNSEAKLCRIMMRQIIGDAEQKYEG